MDMKTYLNNQIREALKYKWCKGVKIGKDPGEQAVSEWIQQHAEEYREEYEECLRKLLNKTIENAEKKMNGICPNCDRKKLEKMGKLIIDEFTNVWFLEMAKTVHDRHVDEI
jgi:hypothetical protein